MNSLFKNNLPRLLLYVLLLTFSISLPAVYAQEFEEMPDPVELFNQGQQAHEAGDLSLALKLYGEALELEPEFPEAEYQRGAAFLQLKKLPEAEKAFRRALEIRENWTLAMSALGGLLVQQNQFQEAETLLTKAIKSSENNFPAYSALTDLRLKTKAAPEILRELLKEIKILTSKANPTASIWVSRAMLERALRETASAKQSLEKAFEIEPKNKTALIETAEIALSEGDFERALRNAKILIDLSPDSVTAKVFLAAVFAEGGNLSETEKILKSLDQTDSKVIEFKKSLVENGSNNIFALEQTLEAEKSNIVVLSRLCVLTRKENPQKSLEYCRQAFELEPENINHAVGYGAALVQQKNHLQASEILYKLKKIAPDNYTLRANLATALFQLKRFQEAKIEYIWLTQQQPELAIAYYFLGIVHDNLEEYLDAMANYQQFLRLADENINELEIGKVNLRLPGLQKQIKKRGK